MSLSRHEQLLLHRVSTALRHTGPDLAVKFAIFRQAADVVQEDPMSPISRVSPLPPDRTAGGYSPLPPDPARDGHSSPLPPDPRLADVSPVPPPRPAPDDQDGGRGQDGESRRGSDAAR